MADLRSRAKGKPELELQKLCRESEHHQRFCSKSPSLDQNHHRQFFKTVVTRRRHSRAPLKLKTELRKTDGDGASLVMAIRAKPFGDVLIHNTTPVLVSLRLWNKETKRPQPNSLKKEIVKMASSVEKESLAGEEALSVELPAPPGWKKKVHFYLFLSL
ncbi:hypothetical protein K1719_011740 [Acacia pycnantha]|nr:hypothetical protein K1719_011740 [Acacia pycnantha]